MGNENSAYGAGSTIAAAGATSGNTVALVGGLAVVAIKVCYDIIDGIRHWFHDCNGNGCRHKKGKTT